MNHNNGSPNIESNRTEERLSLKLILSAFESIHLESVVKKSALSSTDSYSFVSKFVTYVPNEIDMYFKRTITPKF